MAPPFRYAQRPPHNTVPPWHMEARKRHVVNDWKGAKIWLLARCGPCWPVIKLTRGAPRRCAPRNDPHPTLPRKRGEGGEGECEGKGKAHCEAKAKQSTVRGHPIGFMRRVRNPYRPVWIPGCLRCAPPWNDVTQCWSEKSRAGAQ